MFLTHKIATATIAALSTFLPCAIQAASYSFSVGNFSDAIGDQAVVDSSGSIVGTNSVISIGYFSTLDDTTIASIGSTTADLATLNGDFVALGVGNWNVAEEGAVIGLFTATSSSDEADANYVAGIGKSIYVFFGDDTSYLSSTSIGLIDSGVNIADVVGAPGPSSDSLNWSGGNLANDADNSIVGTVILGSITANDVAGIVPSMPELTSSGTFQLDAVTVIPEPSSIALLGLGSLALLLRRSR